jgi:hypothetical protein
VRLDVEEVAVRLGERDAVAHGGQM